MTSNKLK